MSRNSFEIEGKFLRIDSREAKGKIYQTLILEVEGKFTQVVPIRLWGRTEEEAKSWRPGDVLLVRGKLGGRSWQDKVFGDNFAESVEVLSKGAAPAASQGELPIDDTLDPPF